ncbi:hypothetical protein [Spongiactinospora sp. 9N601]|uniref:hypothetical protein n=1 Tax=Spongiactinospora sp. 9N601 TaxID=3375149 RepID=UPI0037A1E40F
MNEIGEVVKEEDAPAPAEPDTFSIIHPHTVIGAPAWPMIHDRGQGALVRDIKDHEYIDGTCGLWPCPVGHGRTEPADVAAA